MNSRNQYIYKCFEKVFEDKATLEVFPTINETIFSEKEKDLLNICKSLMFEKISVNAENIMKMGGKEMLLQYVIICNELEKIKLMEKK